MKTEEDFSSLFLLIQNSMVYFAFLSTFQRLRNSKTSILIVYKKKISLSPLYPDKLPKFIAIFSKRLVSPLKKNTGRADRYETIQCSCPGLGAHNPFVAP